jgi:hypothetical protein
LEKLVFAATDGDDLWWLIADIQADSLRERREDLGVALEYGRNSEWYLDKTKVEALYDAIEVKNRELLRELDDLAVEDSQRQAWVDKVLDVLKAEVAPPASGGPQAGAPSAPKAAAPVTAKKPLFGSHREGADAAPPASPGEATPTPAPPSAPSSRPPAEVAQAVVDEVMATLVPQNYADLAQELGVTENEIQDLVGQLPSDFEQQVAARASEILASRS